MKKTIISYILVIVALSASAQDKLIRVDSESMEWRKDSPQMTFFDKEKSRLLMPKNVAFGVECVPSSSPEWTLTYDSIAHALVYKEAKKSIWHATYTSLHELKQKKNNRKWVLRKNPKDYVAPDVKTFSLPITSEQSQMLMAIWKSAIGDAEDREVNILDGVKWEFFICDKRAKSHNQNNEIVKFVKQLADSIWTGNNNSKDSLINAEFQRVVGILNVVPTSK